MPTYWATAGRAILGLFFLLSGVGKLIGEPMAMQEMVRHGFPLVVPLYWATAVFETVVGGALVLGVATAWSSALLALFTLLTALTIHDFWNDPAGSMERMRFSFLASNNEAVAATARSITSETETLAMFQVNRTRPSIQPQPIPIP